MTADPFQDLYSVSLPDNGLEVSGSQEIAVAAAMDALDVPLDPYLAECVRLEADPLSITEAYVRLAADMARWNELLARATEATLKAELRVSRSKAQVALQLRKNPRLALSTYRMERLTEGFLEDLVAVNRDVVAAQDAFVEARTQKGRLEGILTALEKKGYALVSLGATLRAEMAAPTHLNSR